MFRYYYFFNSHWQITNKTQMEEYKSEAIILIENSKEQGKLF